MNIAAGRIVAVNIEDPWIRVRLDEAVPGWVFDCIDVSDLPLGPSTPRVAIQRVLSPDEVTVGLSDVATDDEVDQVLSWLRQTAAQPGASPIVPTLALTDAVICRLRRERDALRAQEG